MDQDENICPASFLKLAHNNDTVLDTLRKYLTPDQADKKMFGEVFTPLELVCDMLSKLPKSVWTNKNLKWLDPANGIGNFPVIVYYKLMSTLSSVIKNKDERSKHIIENMLFMVELNPINVSLCKKVFKMLDSYANPNIIKGSFLEQSTLAKLPEEFDVIIGNPPYNDSSGNKGKGHELWKLFVEKSLNILHKNGYLCFVHPASWRQIDSQLLSIMKSKQILYLEIHNSKDGNTTFKSSTRYDWYVIQNKDYEDETVVKDEEGVVLHVDLRDWSFIPNMMFYDINKLIHTKGDKLDVHRHRSDYGTEKEWVSKTKNKTFKYPLINSINKKNIPDMRYTDRNDKGHFKQSKFIFSNGAGFLSDPTGKYGLTEWAYCIYDTPEHIPLIEKAFRSKKFNKIKYAIQLGSQSYNVNIMKLFKKDFYKEFEHDETVDIQSGNQGKSLRKSKLKKMKRITKRKNTFCINKKNSKTKRELKSREKFRRSMCKKINR
jgi:hypothetical protein